jgi:hypothetical protein
VAVVSWSFWKRRFNLDPAILGKRGLRGIVWVNPRVGKGSWPLWGLA